MKVIAVQKYSIFGTSMGWWAYVDGKLILGSYGRSEHECLVNAKKQLRKII